MKKTVYCSVRNLFIRSSQFIQLPINGGTAVVAENERANQQLLVLILRRREKRIGFNETRVLNVDRVRVK